MLPLLGGLYAPAVTPAAKPVEIKRLRVTVGQFYSQGKLNDSRTEIGATYQTKFHIGSFGPPVVYLDSNRRKFVTPLTSTTTSSRVTTLQGIGLAWLSDYPAFFGPQSYFIKGIGLYQQRISVDGVNSTGYSPGLKLGIGYRYDDLFAEANYTLIGRIKGTDPSGLSIKVGVRL